MSLPAIKKPSKASILRSMNRDLLLGLVIPGPDKFEVRGWVRWLLGNPNDHLPSDPHELEAYRKLQGLSDDQLVDVQLDAAQWVLQHEEGGDPDFKRGAEAHDHLMEHLLTGAEHVESVRFAAYASDTDMLLDMLDISSDDLQNEQFLEGFRAANKALADHVTEQLGQ